MKTLWKFFSVGKLAPTLLFAVMVLADLFYKPELRNHVFTLIDVVVLCINVYVMGERHAKVTV